MMQAEWITQFTDAEDFRSFEEFSALLHIELERMPTEQVLKQEDYLLAILSLVILAINSTMAEIVRRSNPCAVQINEMSDNVASIKPLENDLMMFKKTLEFYYECFHRLRWDKNLTQDQILQMFLPPGFWPNTSNKQSNRVLLSENEVSDDDKRIDKDKLSFYRSIGCRKIVEPKEGTDFYDRKYIAFIFGTITGDRIAVLDTEVTKNAAYLFRVGRVNEKIEHDWMTDAVKTKYELIYRVGPAQHFIGRLIHSKKWQLKLKLILWIN